MNTALWVVQIFLAVVFASSGLAKLTMSKPRMIATGQTGVAPFPLPIIRATAACEVLAAAGLILPGPLNTAPMLTSLAAVGLMVVMIGAAISHASLREYPQVALNIVLFLLAGFVALGRA